MSYLSRDAIEKMGFKSLGENILISDKASIYNANQIEIGDNSRIDDFSVISGCIKIGKYVHVAAFSLLAGGEEGIVLEDFSGCAYGVKIFSQSDDYSGETLTNPTIPKAFKNELKKKVTVGKHVIIGASSIVLPGVNIAEGCSLGAMSMLTKSTEPWGVYFGSPAKRIKNRKQNLLALEKQFLDELYK